MMLNLFIGTFNTLSLFVVTDFSIENFFALQKHLSIVYKANITSKTSPRRKLTG